MATRAKVRVVGYTPHGDAILRALSPAARDVIVQAIKGGHEIEVRLPPAKERKAKSHGLKLVGAENAKRD